MRAAADMISLVASDDCGHPLFVDTRVAHHNNPAWFCACTSWRGCFHAYIRFNKSIRAIANGKFSVFYETVLPFIIVLRNPRPKVPENLPRFIDKCPEEHRPCPVRRVASSMRTF
jgi:hypothetical protein